MDRLHVATLNIRNLADRWFERLPLLLADMATLQPDLLGLQEVVYVMQQDRLIGAAGEGRYGVVRGWAGRPGVRQQPAGPRAASRDGHRSAGPWAGPLRSAFGRHPAGRLDGPRRRHAPPPPHPGRDPARRADGSPPGVARRERRPPTPPSSWATSTPTPPSPLPPACARPGSCRPTPRPTAPSPRSPGRRASRRRRWTPTGRPSASTTSGSAAPFGSSPRGSCSIVRIPRTRALPERPPGHRHPARDRVGERWQPGRSDWPIAATGARRRRTRSPRSPRRSRSRPATASSSTSASRPTGCR